ncbi:MAG TPA: hypothetical protein VM925_24370, partial [Labilithrix sp.]|nr:hypothetical protein [Labilithrix sp.]
VLGVLQTLVRVDAERLVLAGYEPERRFRGTAFGGHALAGIRAPLGSRAWIDLDMRGELLAAPVGGSLAGSWSAGAAAAAGVSF